MKGVKVIILLCILISGCATLKNIETTKLKQQKDIRQQFEEIVKSYELNSDKNSFIKGNEYYRITIESNDIPNKYSQIDFDYQAFNTEGTIYMDTILKDIAESQNLLFLEKSGIIKEDVNIKIEDLEKKGEEQIKTEIAVKDPVVAIQNAVVKEVKNNEVPATEGVTEQTDRDINSFIYKSKYHLPLGVKKIKGNIKDIIESIEYVTDTNVKIKSGKLLVEDMLSLYIELPNFLQSTNNKGMNIIQEVVKSLESMYDSYYGLDDNSTVNDKKQGINIFYDQPSSILVMRGKPNFFRDNYKFLEELLNKSFSSGLIEVAVYVTDDNIISQLGFNNNIKNAKGTFGMGLAGGIQNTAPSFDIQYNINKLFGMPNVSVSSIINALETIGGVKTVNKYYLQVFNGVSSKFKSTSQIGYVMPGNINIEEQTMTNNTTIYKPTTIDRPELKTEDVGIEFSITPKIYNDKRFIILNINYSQKELINYLTTTWQPSADADLSIEIKSPLISEYATETVVKVKNDTPAILMGSKQINESLKHTLLTGTFVPLGYDKSSKNSKIMIYVKGFIPEYEGIKNINIE